MTHRSILPALALGFLLALSAGTAWGQHHMTGNDYDDGPGGGDPNPSEGCTGVQAKVTVSGLGLSFSPALVTLDPGQPVCWTWSGSEHTVKADDGSFTSGPPTANGTFQRTFNTPGTYGYYCQVHGTTSGGMRGTVVVRGSSGSGAGTLALASTSYTADEGVGVLTVIVERLDGSDGAASVKFETTNGSAKSKKDFTSRNGTLSWGAGDQDPKTIEVPIKNDSAKEKDETFKVKLSKAAGAGLGASSATVTNRDDDGGGCSSAVAAPAALEARGQSDSEIHLTWDEAAAVRIERREPGGAFREIAAVEAGVGTFTDVGLPAGTALQYRVRSGDAVSEIVAAATDGSTAPCDESRGLCLGDGRFEARIAGSRSSDPQLLLNVRDGCGINGHYWLSLAAVTDVELTVQVRDTQTGRTWAWFKPAGRLPAPVRDVEAFAGCP